MISTFSIILTFCLLISARSSFKAEDRGNRDAHIMGAPPDADDDIDDDTVI